MMDYSLLLGMHYRGGHHLTPLTTDRVRSNCKARPFEVIAIYTFLYASSRHPSHRFKMAP